MSHLSRLLRRLHLPVPLHLLVPLLLLAPCLTPVTAAGVGGLAPDDEAVKEFRKAWKRADRARDPKTARMQALDLLDSLDSPEVAEQLVEAFADLEAEALPIERKRQDTLDSGNGASAVSSRADLDPIRKVQNRVLERICRLHQPGSLEWLALNVVADKRQPLQLKLRVSERTRALGDRIVPAYTTALSRARNAEQRVVLLGALATLGAAARPAAEPVVMLLSDDDAAVRAKAAWAAACLGLPQAIEPLIDRLEEETLTRPRKHFALCLEVLTRQKLGLTVSAWRQWLEREGEPYLSGAVPLGGGESNLQEDAGSGYYHGIPQDGHSIVYIVDVSGSMMVSMKNPVEGPDGRRPVAALEGDESRMEASKKALIAALGQLPEGTLFNIVTYANDARRYSPKMVKASAGSIRKAQAYVEDLSHGGATNIYDALDSAFGIAGRGAFDRHYDTQVDTMFLLTDGRPMLPSGGGDWDDTDRIVEGVRRWNAERRIVLHCIGLGKNVNDDFLRQLAKEHNGQFVQK